MTPSLQAAAPPRDTSLGRRASDARDRSARHSDFTLNFLLPISLIVTMAMIALVGGALWLTALQDRGEGINERARVRASFIAQVEGIAATTRVFAVWDDAARKVVATFDPVWIDQNIGAYVFDQNRIEATFVIDQAGRTLYGYVDSKRSLADPAVELGRGFAVAVRDVTGASPVRDRPLGGISIGRRGTVMFSIVRIRPHGPISGIPRRINRYLVMAKKVDDQVVAQVARRSESRQLSLAARPGPDRASWRFASYDGLAARSFQWDAKRPGLHLFGATAPLLALLIVMIGGLAALVLRRARKAARELMASETRARYLASRDPLTGLANRRAFNDHLVELNRRGRRHALMFLDLDGFKKVNDTFGHGVGDKLLCRTAERLQRMLPPNAFLARLGGDEFAITVPQPGCAGEVETLAARLIETVGEPHQFGGEPTTVGVSIGIAASEAGKYEEVVRHADTAMYVAKQRGRNRWQHFECSLEEGREERRRLELDLKQALVRHEIFVLFQPIVDAQSGRIITVEALARWTHPTLGPILPDVFIPIAEESGLIVELGQQILEQACIAARHWPYRLAVNLSPAQFWEGNLVGQVIATLARLDFPAKRLKFEITENYLLSQPDAADAVIRDLRRHGIRIALDDFGTGYASIGYLRRFQFDLVKIDRSLVEAVATDSAAADVLLAIVSLCRALDLPILAEGVETAEQAAMLRANGCKYLQGWHFGRPVSAREIDAIVAAQCRNVA